MLKNIPQRQKGNVDEIAFTLSVKIRIVLIAGLIAGFLVLLYSRLNREQREIANFGATTFGVSIAGVTAIHAYRGIIQTQAIAEKNRREDRAITEKIRREDRAIAEKIRLLERTIDYISQWHSEDIDSKIATIKVVLSNAKERHMRISKYLETEDGSKHNQDVISILNFFEKISFLAVEGDLNKDKLATFYRDIFYSYYDEFHQFIQDRREDRKQEKLYEYFEKLHHEWHVNGY